MQPAGPKIAEGRDSEIFEHGPGKVLRVARDGRSLVAEAEIMRLDRIIVPIGRRVMLRAFLSRVDKTAARRAIPAAVDHRRTDRNVTPAELTRMDKFAAWAADG